MKPGDGRVARHLSFHVSRRLGIRRTVDAALFRECGRGAGAWILRQALKRTAPTGGADRSGQHIWDGEGGLSGEDAAAPAVTAVANSSKRVCSKR